MTTDSTARGSSTERGPSTEPAAAPPTTRRSDEVLAVAEFDERLPAYFMLQVVATLLLTFIFIPIIPFWLVLGMPFHRKQYQALSAVLTRRSLKIEGGVLVKVQKSVPLDKITDLALNEGPILRHFGLCSLKVETAGGGQGTATGHAALVGVKDAIAFRDQVLAQRDAIVFGEDGASRGAGSAAVASAADATSSLEGSNEVLTDIRDSLRRIETLMQERASEGR